MTPFVTGFNLISGSALCSGAADLVVDNDGDKDQKAEHQFLERCIDILQVHEVLDDTDDQRTDDRVDNCSGTAAHGSTADDNRRDGVHFVGNRRSRLTGIHTGHKDDTCN